MSQKDFLKNQRQRLESRLHQLWGNSQAGDYDKREWEVFQADLGEYFSEVEKLIESNTDQKG